MPAIPIICNNFINAVVSQILQFTIRRIAQCGKVSIGWKTVIKQESCILLLFLDQQKTNASRSISTFEFSQLHKICNVFSRELDWLHFKLEDGGIKLGFQFSRLKPRR